MLAASLAARVFLAGVFLIAAMMKLARPARTRQAMIDFGVTVRLAGLTAGGVVTAELLVSLALLIPSSARWGAVAAVGQLAGFSAAVCVVLRTARQRLESGGA